MQSDTDSTSTVRQPAQGRIWHPEPLSAQCEQCRTRFTPQRGSQGRFCTKACYWAWWKSYGQQEMAEKGLRKLERLKAEGQDPRATEKATYKRRMAFRNSALTLADVDDGLSDDEAWAERGAYWQARADPEDQPFSPWDRTREDKPLVLGGHGVRLRIRHGALEVRQGFTHYPQKPKTVMLWPGDRRMPSRIVLIDVDGMVTFDVIEFLSRQGVPMLVLNSRGPLVSALGGGLGALDFSLCHAQLEAASNSVGLRIANDLIGRKILASMATLETLPGSDRLDVGLDRLTEAAKELRYQLPVGIPQLLMVEARAANAYFASWLDTPIRWKGTNRRQIPPEWYRMPLRGSLLGERNRHATHPVMAALNYAYGVLEGQVLRAVETAGLDPAVAYLHTARPGRRALVFDLMEPLRPMADRLILDFIRSHTLSPGDVFLTERGVCRLHPQLARAIARIAVTEDAVSDEVERLIATLRLAEPKADATARSSSPSNS